SSRRRHTRFSRDWSSDVCSSDLGDTGRKPFDAAAAHLLAEFKPAVVSFHFGLPAPELLALVKSWGSKVMASATTVAEARWLERRSEERRVGKERRARWRRCT